MNATTRSKYIPTRHQHLRRNDRTGVFCLWFKHKGQRHQPSLETTDEKLAIERRDAKIKDIKERISGGGPVIVGKKTLAELFNDYLKYSKDRMDTLTDDRITQASYDSISSGVDKIKADNESWLDRDACKITAKEFADYAKLLGKEKISPSYFNKVIDALKNAYKYGVAEHLISFNPAKDLKRAKQSKVAGGKILTEEQYAAVLKYILRPESCNCWKQKIADTIEFLSYFGTRINTARNILKTDVKLAERKIWIRVSKGKEEGEAYWIPICDAAVPLIEKLLEAKSRGREEYLIPIRQCYRTLREAFKTLGFNVTCPHHTFRHMAATRWIEAGCNMKDVSYWLGHRDSVITQQVYQHVRTKAAEIEAQKLNRIGMTVMAPAALLPKIVVAGKTYSHTELEALVKRAQAVEPKQIAA